MRDDSLPAVLRRRADSLLSDGYGDVMLKPILRAAEEIKRLEKQVNECGVQCSAGMQAKDAEIERLRTDLKRIAEDPAVNTVPDCMIVAKEALA